jgi:hypothetical protein
MIMKWKVNCRLGQNMKGNNLSDKKQLFSLVDLNIIVLLSSRISHNFHFFIQRIKLDLLICLQKRNYSKTGI